MPFERKRMHPSSGMVMKLDDTVFDLGKMLDNSSDPNNIHYSLTYAHGAVHRDAIINATYYQASGTGDWIVLITPGSPLQLHLTYVATSEGGMRVRFYEAPTVTTLGTEITSTRLFRPSTKTTQATLTQGGTVSDFGTLLKDDYNGGSGPSRGGSAVHDDAEFVLKVDATYCVRVTRLAPSITHIEFEWYEAQPL